VRLHVRACGVCRTDLHLAEGDLSPRGHLVIPGHEVVGVVDQVGPGCSRFAGGDRVGVPWLARTCGTCRFCGAGRENLCLAPLFTGWDLDGGYAEYVVVDEGFAYAIPSVFSDEEAAPLLCAGIIGYRALSRCQLPPGGRLGIYGILVVAGIHLTDIPTLNYERHLFEERVLCSVTANTRSDGNEFLDIAARISIRVSAISYRIDQADQALEDLANDRVNGAAVLVNRPGW
jgi:D-arabinose 1-dehydrogenase-like Zn-dependent alcohol dehydrogenase